MAWDDDKVDLLKKLWADGLSAGVISNCIPGVSRMAVIGKVHRLGLATRTTTERSAKQRGGRMRQKNLKPRLAWNNPTSPAARAFRALNLPVDAPPPVEEIEIPLKQRKTIATLADTSCRWPIGDPQRADFHFCGKEKIAGLSYCEPHARRAYQPPQPRYRAPAPAAPVPSFADAEKESV